MSTQVESNNLDDIFQAIRAAHDSAKSAGAKRIISTIRIDERLDKPNTLEEKVQSKDKNTLRITSVHYILSRIALTSQKSPKK